MYKLHRSSRKVWSNVLCDTHKTLCSVVEELMCPILVVWLWIVCVTSLDLGVLCCKANSIHSSFIKCKEVCVTWGLTAGIGFETSKYGSYSSTSRSTPGAAVAEWQGHGVIRKWESDVASLTEFSRHGNEWDDTKTMFPSEETYI